MVEGREQNSVIRDRITVYVQTQKRLRSVLGAGCNKEVASRENVAAIEKDVDEAYSDLLETVPDNLEDMYVKVSFLMEEILADADITEYHKIGLKTAMRDLKKVKELGQFKKENQTVDVAKSQ